MYEIRITSHFKKDLKKIKKRITDYELVKVFVKQLQENGIEGVSAILKPHKLVGNYKNHFEVHIKPDLLIIWIQIENPDKITLVRIGSHSDLFK